MARDAKRDVGRWRQGNSVRPASPVGPTKASKWTEAAALSALLLVAVAIAGWIVFQFVFNNGPNPYFVPFWVGSYKQPGIPSIAGMDADREALRAARVFTTVESAEDQTATLEVMRTRLDFLPTRTRDDSVVVFFAAQAVVDHDGKIRILAADSNPYQLQTQLPLSHVLAQLKKCPVKNKLLVLDTMRSMVDPRDIGGTTDGVADLVLKELENEADSKQFNDPNLLVITACSPGEVARGSETLGHSAFGYYFNQGLASSEADVNGDRLIQVRELADYLTRNVDGWSLRYRGVHQRPALLGPQGLDFALAMAKDGGTEKSADGGKAKKPSEAGTAKEPAGEAKAAPAKEEADKAKSAGGDAAKGAKDGSGSGESAEPEGGAYPQWLADGWKTVESWWSSDDFRAAPRVYRRLARRLTRAEGRWRGGVPPEQVRRELEDELRDLRAAMDQARKITLPPIRSVGQARALQGWKSDAALTAALTDLLKQRRNLGDSAPEQTKAAVKGALDKFKDKSSLDLAGALIDAANDEVLDVPGLGFLDSIVEQSKLPRDLIELRFLHQLAVRAARSATGDWKSETAKTAWDTILLAEQANNQPQALAWVHAPLDQADASLHEAQVLLLPEAAGFASWPQIAAAWDDAKDKYQALADRQHAIHHGQVILSKSLMALAGLIPYLEATRQLQSDWLEAAEKAVVLARLMEPPRPEDSPVESLGAQLNDATRQLETPYNRLLRPFQHDAIEALVQQCRSSAVEPDPAVALQIEALLTTPFLSAQDRQALRSAQLALDRRLQAIPLRSDANASAAGGRGELPRDRARRRFERMATFLKLAGDEKNAGRLDILRDAIFHASEINKTTAADLAWDMTDPVSVWQSMARCAEMAYVLFEQLLNKSDRSDESDRIGSLAPVYVRGFDDWPSNPVRRGRERDALAAWAWLAGHYRHQSHDLHELVDPDSFLDKAGRECLALCNSQGPPEIGLKIDGLPAKLNLSAKQPTATASFQLRLTGADAAGPQKAMLSLLKTDDPRLSVTEPEPTAPDVSSEAATTAALTITWSDDAIRAAGPPPAGFLVRVRMADHRTYHALVPVGIVSADMFPRLALSSDPVQSDDLPTDPLRLRPIAGAHQHFFVFVKNPSLKLWNVIVEILEGDKVLASAGSNQQPLSVKAGSSLVVPSFGTPAPKPDNSLPELAGPLRLRLRELAGTVLDEQPIPLAIATPREYIEVGGAQFVPAAPGQPNRLTVSLRALPQMTGPPCPVELVLPLDKELFPILQAPPKEGTLTGTLEVGKPPVTLYAEKIALGPGDDVEGSFYVNVDGVKRALWFRSRFPEVGGPQQQMTEPQKPRVRFHPVLLVVPGQSARLRVEFAVDNAPAGARLAFRLGRLEGGRFKDDLTPWTDAAKRRHLGFDPKGDGGALLVEASLEDWVREWRVDGLLGRRTLQARLLDATGRRVLDSHETSLVLDDQPPQEVALELRDRIEKGTPNLVVDATVKPPASGIKEVAFAFSSEADFEKAVAARQVVVKSQPNDADGRSWTATLTVPKDATGKLVVTARFKTGVGLTAFKSEEVTVIEPPKDDAKAAKKEEPKPGAIVGTVIEGDRPQAGLKVLLVDLAPPAATKNQASGIKETVTDAKGAFSFKDLDPKRYRLYCTKQDGINNRIADKQVNVESGQTVQVELELVR